MSDDNHRRPGRPRTFNRQRALTLAVDSYWREGFYSLSLNELCRRAGISKPALYREFGGADGLMAAALEHYNQAIVQPVLDALSMSVPFAELVEHLIVGMTTVRETPAGCLFTEMRIARSRLGAQTAAHIAQMEQQRRTVFEDWYRYAVEKGEANPSIPPALAAYYIDTQISTVLIQMGAGEPAAQVQAQARLAFQILTPQTS